MPKREESHKVKVSGAGNIALEDLRWLVEQCKGFRPSSRVEVVIEEGQRDSIVDEIIVHGDPEAKPTFNYREPKPTITTTATGPTPHWWKYETREQG